MIFPGFSANIYIYIYIYICAEVAKTATSEEVAA